MKLTDFRWNFMESDLKLDQIYFAIKKKNFYRHMEASRQFNVYEDCILLRVNRHLCKHH